MNMLRLADFTVGLEEAKRIFNLDLIQNCEGSFREDGERVGKWLDEYERDRGPPYWLYPKLRSMVLNIRNDREL